MANTKVTTGVIKDDAVGADQLASNAVVTASITDNAVTTAKINDDAILTAKISNSAVTNAKLSANSVDSDQYVDASIDTAHIRDGQITSAKLDTNISVAGTLTLGSHLIMGDNDRIKIGSGTDLEIYHDGSDTFIDDSTGTGNLYVLSNQFLVNNANGTQNMGRFADGGAVTLYYAGDAKIATTSSGIDVTGTFTANGATISSGSSGATASGNADELILEGSGNTGLSILSGATSLGNLFFADSGDAADGYIQYDQNGRSMRLGTAGGEKVRIDSSGNVGIGTTSPSKTLHVNGELQIENNLTLNENTPAMVIPNGDFRLFTGGSEAMRIDQSQNVGIGETSPANLLHVKASDTGIAPHTSAQIVLEREGTNYLQFLTAETGTSGLLFGDGSDVDVSKITVDHNTTKMTFTNETVDTMTLNGANVGIGDSAPQDFLEVRGTSLGGITISNSNHSQAALSFARSSTATARIFISEPAALHTSAMHFQTSTAASGPTLVTAMTIDQSQNVGIGTTSPDTKLHVHKGSAGSVTALSDSSLVIENSSHNYLTFLSPNNVENAIIFGDADSNNQGGLSYHHSTNHMGFKTSGTERMRIDSSGDVRIGSISNAYAFAQKLRVGDGDDNDGISINSGSSHQGNLAFCHGSGGNTAFGRISYQHNSNYMQFFTNNTERMRLDSSGKVLVGKTVYNNDDNGIAMNPTGTSWFTATDDYPLGVNRKNTDGTLIQFTNDQAGCGTISCSGTSTAYNTSSDYRLKENVAPIQNGLTRLQQLNPVQFDWINSGETSEGFIAHEVQEIFSDAVTGEKDAEEMQGMDYGRITPLLVKAIQEQQEQIEELKQEIQELKG